MKSFFRIAAGMCFLLAVPVLAQEKPVVTGIQALSGNGTKVVVLWKLPEQSAQQITNLFVYRDTAPISSVEKLRTMTPVAVLDGNAVQYIDYLTDFKDYFYAVMSITEEGLVDILMYSVNSTVKGIHLTAQKNTKAPPKEKEEKRYERGSLREMPLPYIDLIEDLNAEPAISHDVVDATREFSSGQASAEKLMRTYVFEEDLVAPDGGDDFRLFTILRNTFIQRKYEDAITELNRLVGTNISGSTRNRAYFYLGESQYFTGDYEAAVKTFIRLENTYPALVKQWINASVDSIVID